MDGTSYVADRILIDGRFAGLPVLLYYIRSFSPLDPTTIMELGHHVPRKL